MTKRDESALSVERLGGAASFGSPHLKSRGEVAWESLSDSDRDAVERLFSASPKSRGENTPGERYRITRQTARGKKTITVSSGHTPAMLRSSVKDTLD